MYEVHRVYNISYKHYDNASLLSARCVKPGHARLTDPTYTIYELLFLW